MAGNTASRRIDTRAAPRRLSARRAGGPPPRPPPSGPHSRRIRRRVSAKGGRLGPWASADHRSGRRLCGCCAARPGRRGSVTASRCPGWPSRTRQRGSMTGTGKHGMGSRPRCAGCTCCTRPTVQDGVPLYDVQALLGHEDYGTTMRYAHLAPDAHGKVIESWNRRTLRALDARAQESRSLKTRNRPLTWVGVAGFEPAASSSRSQRARSPTTTLRCLTCLALSVR